MDIFRSSPWIRKAGLSLGILTLGTGAILLPACGEGGEIAEDRENVTTEDFPQTSTVAESIGEEVTVRSTITESLDTNGVLLQSEAGENILALNVSSGTVPLPTDDTPIQVTGQAVEFILADIEAQYGLDLDENLYADYEEQPAILADSWALAPTPEMLAEQPEAYYNQIIALEGDARILSDNALALYEDGWIDDVGILVVGVDKSLRSDGSNIQEGESVTVTGMAQPLDLNVLKGEYDLGLNEEELNEFANRYTDRPVIMAEDTYPTAVDE
jgi:hypothetical protein